MIFNGQRITPKQEKILILLKQFRGMRYDQLIPLLAERLGRDVGVSFQKNTYKDLQELDQMKLIVRDPLKLQRTVDFIYLSETGLECACELLEIPVGHFGSGWNDDWGDFPYELYRPPRVGSAVIHHHMMLTDTLLTFEHLKAYLPDLQLDYRDNRYCSFEFKWQGETHRFRPDADLNIGEHRERYLIEVDRGTEFGEKLREKFCSYDGYLSYLQDRGEPLPEGVIFIMNKATPNGLLRRWSLVSAAFMDQMQKWSTRFNLIGGGVADIESILLRLLSKSNDYDDFFKKMSYYRTETVSFVNLKEGQGIPWRSAPFSIAKSESENRLYVYERVEPFETLGVARIHAWWKWYQEAKQRYSDIGKSKFFIPVLWRPKGGPAPLNFIGFENDKEFNEAFTNWIWLTTVPHPQWFNKSGERITTGHPLTRFPL